MVDLSRRSFFLCTLLSTPLVVPCDRAPTPDRTVPTDLLGDRFSTNLVDVSSDGGVSSDHNEGDGPRRPRDVGAHSDLLTRSSQRAKQPSGGREQSEEDAAKMLHQQATNLEELQAAHHDPPAPQEEEQDVGKLLVDKEEHETDLDRLLPQGGALHNGRAAGDSADDDDDPHNVDHDHDQHNVEADEESRVLSTEVIDLGEDEKDQDQMTEEQFEFLQNFQLDEHGALVEKEEEERPGLEDEDEQGQGGKNATSLGQSLDEGKGWFPSKSSWRSRFA